jgi:hypothetical protein
MPGQSSEKGTDVQDRFDADFMTELDGRLRLARTLRDRLAALTDDLGGTEALSYQEQSICKRAIHLERLIEKKESALAQGLPVDEHVYFACVNALSGLLSKIGLKRRARPAISLNEVLNGKDSHVGK